MLGSPSHMSGLPPRHPHLSQSDVKLEVSENEQEVVRSPITAKRFSILADLDELDKELQANNNRSSTQNNTNNNKQYQHHPPLPPKKSSYSDDLIRKTLQLTYQYDQTGDRVLKLNLSDRDEQKSENQSPVQQPPSIQTQPPQPAPNRQVQKKQPRYSQQPEFFNELSSAHSISTVTKNNSNSHNSVAPFTVNICPPEPAPRPPLMNMPNNNAGKSSKQNSCQSIIIRNNPRMYKTVREVDLTRSPENKQFLADFSHELYKNTSILAQKQNSNTEYNLFSKAIQTERKTKESFGACLKYRK